MFNEQISHVTLKNLLKKFSSSLLIEAHLALFSSVVFLSINKLLQTQLTLPVIYNTINMLWKNDLLLTLQ